MDKVDATTPELGDPEKTREPSASSFDLDDKDEALRLVGLERVESITPEEYLKLRRKLVSLHDTLVHSVSRRPIFCDQDCKDVKTMARDFCSRHERGETLFCSKRKDLVRR